MDNEYELLSQNNEKYSIKIDDYKARLRAIQKDFQKETFRVSHNFLKKQIKSNLNVIWILFSFVLIEVQRCVEIIRKSLTRVKRK